MSRGKSQWDFGELFPAGSLRRVLTVAELTGNVRRALEREIGSVWVTGEVTNLRLQASGHIYFTLKDATAQLACVLFRNEAVVQREALRDGQKLILGGDVTVYEPRGTYQLRVTAVELQGVGALQVAFERLKQKLQAEGLFNAGRKRPLPRHPQRLGVVSSPTGAALRDVLHVIARRQPALEIILAPCRVQGEGAAAEIAAAIRLLNQWSAAQPPGLRLDLVLLTRGGGSLEDLWAFNEEVVARVVFESVLPVVSAVGHEIDFTISDFVADVRAATPSAAAEIITEGAQSSRQFVAEAAALLRRRVRQQLIQAGGEVNDLSRRLSRVHPRRVLQERLQLLDDLQTALVRVARSAWRERRLNWQHAAQRLGRLRPTTVIQFRREALRELSRRLREQAGRRVQDRRQALATVAARLRLLAPQNVLARGYSITLDAATGRIVRRAAEAPPGRRLKTQLHEGEIRSVVEE